MQVKTAREKAISHIQSATELGAGGAERDALEKALKIIANEYFLSLYDSGWSEKESSIKVCAAVKNGVQSCRV